MRTMKPELRIWWQTALVTAGAIAVFAGARAVPVGGSDLHYTDFDAGGKSFLEFCEPGSPQFAPVDRVRSPVSLKVEPRTTAVAGELVEVDLSLLTSAGKLIRMEDLLVVHTEKLHLLIVGPSLDDYQHVHPSNGRGVGTFSFSFTPKSGGVYKVFADFMPRATGRSLYAGAELAVSPRGNASEATDAAPRQERLESTVDEVRFRLSIPEQGLRINEPAGIGLSVENSDGSPVVLEEVMGAPAHVVAFDAARSGFAHLHPAEREFRGHSGGIDPSRRLDFTLFLTEPGLYRLWAQLKIEGRERFVSFDLNVRP